MTENSDFDRSARRPDEPSTAPSFDPYAANPPAPGQPAPSGSSTPEPPPYSTSSPPSPTPSYSPPPQQDPPAPDPSSPPPYAAGPSSAPPDPPPYTPAPDPSSAPPYGTPPGGYQPGAGYTPPPGGAYQTPGAYQAPGYPAAGQPYAGAASSDEKTWNLVSHLGAAVAVFVSSGALGWVPPLVSMLAKGKENPTVRMHAVESLNFQLTWAIVWFAGLVLGTCGLVIVVGAVFYLACLVAYVVAIVFSIIAGVKANNGEFYRYPMTIRMVK